MQIYIYIHTNILILRISMSVLAINWPWISLHVSAISQQSVNISPKPEPVQLTLFCQDAIGSSYGEVVHGAICQGVENVNLWPCHLGKRRSLKLIHEYNIPTKISLNSVIYIYIYIIYIQCQSISFNSCFWLLFLLKTKTYANWIIISLYQSVHLNPNNPRHRPSILFPSRLPSRESDKHSSPAGGPPRWPSYGNTCGSIVAYEPCPLMSILILRYGVLTANSYKVLQVLFLQDESEGNATAVML